MGSGKQRIVFLKGATMEQVGIIILLSICLILAAAAGVTACAAIGFMAIKKAWDYIFKDDERNDRTNV